MLIQLLPDQAVRYWEDVKVAIEESLPPVVGMQSDRMSNILQAILIDEVTVWVSLERKEIGPSTVDTITGLVLTTFSFDKISGTKSLILYVIFGYGIAKLQSWSEGLEAIRKFAKAKNCHRIIGYTDVPSMIKYAKSIGADTRYTLISIPLE